MITTVLAKMLSVHQEFIMTLLERGVKLVAVFLHLATEEDNLQNYMQVVEEDR